MHNRASGQASRPAFVTLQRAYPSNLLSPAQLYDELGIRAQGRDSRDEHVGALRLSYALVRAGVALPRGGLEIPKGPYIGKRVEPSMRRLAEHLVVLWGRAEQFDSDRDATAALVLRQGVVVCFLGDFLPIAGVRGHIGLHPLRRSGFDASRGTGLLGPDNKVWFWPLP